MPLDLSKAQEAKPRPDIITCNNSVIDACAKSGDIEKSGAAEKKSGDEKKASPSIGRKRKRSDSSSSCTSSSSVLSIGDPSIGGDFDQSHLVSLAFIAYSD